MKDHRKTIVAEGYDSIGEAYLAWSSHVLDDPRDRVLDEFSARIASGARVLDLGCGAGLLSTKALASRFEVTGVDISEGQMRPRAATCLKPRSFTRTLPRSTSRQDHSMV